MAYAEAILRSTRWHLPLLLIVVAAVYGQVAGHEFVFYDDDQYVYANEELPALSLADAIAWSFTATANGNWQPLTWLSHWLDVQLFGLEPAGHHLVNLLFHLANTWLVYLFLSRATANHLASLAVAALFALHPSHVESVAWVSERKDVLSALFFLLALLAYLRFVVERGWPWYLLVLALFALGLMAKSMLVTLPCVLLLLDVWPLRRFRPGESAREGEASDIGVARLLLEKLPLFLVAGTFAAVAVVTQGSAAAIGSVSLAVRAANAVVSYAAYIGATIWPSGLAVFYPHPGMPGTLAILLSLLLLVAVTLWAGASLRARPYLAVGWFWFLGTLVPVIGLVQIGWQARADRYLYIPHIGLFIACVWYAAEFVRVRHMRSWAAGVTLLLVAMCALTWRQVATWRDSYTLFEHAAAVTERNYVAHARLGKLHADDGNLEPAERHLLEALRYKPDYPEPHGTLGNIYYERGEFERAVASYRRLWRLTPDSWIANFNLALALLRIGEREEGMVYLMRAQSLRPDEARIRRLLERIHAGAAQTPES